MTKMKQTLLTALAAPATAEDSGLAAPGGDPSIIIAGERLERPYQIKCGITEGASTQYPEN